MSHEKSITIQDEDGRWINIPSVFDGVELSDDEAILAYKTGQIKPLGDTFYNTVDEAVKAAEGRSEGFNNMPNDPASKILEMFGMNSYTGEPQRPMARRGRGGVNGQPQSQDYSGDVPDPDNPAQMSRYTQQEASVPGDPDINASGMSDMPEFQEAVAIFAQQTGREPATDSDFEMGVVPIMQALMYGADPGFDDEMLTVPDSILKQMGEEPPER